MNKLKEIISTKGRKRLCGVPEGSDALLLRELLDAVSDNRTILHIARDEKRMVQLGEALAFFAGEVQVLALPAGRDVLCWRRRLRLCSVCRVLM